MAPPRPCPKPARAAIRALRLPQTRHSTLDAACARRVVSASNSAAAPSLAAAAPAPPVLADPAPAAPCGRPARLRFRGRAARRDVTRERRGMRAARRAGGVVQDRPGCCIPGHERSRCARPMQQSQNG
eukprot:132288-Chlamydomonas_euryale.AAC.3